MDDISGRFLFKEKQIRLLLALRDESKEWHISDLAKKNDVTYIHATKFVNRCEALGLLSVENHGRIKKLLLTEKGKNIAESIYNILNSINAEKKEE